MGYSDVIVGRQGVYDTEGPSGYELVFRGSQAVGGQLPAAGERAAAVMIAVVAIGLDRLVAGHDIYCVADSAVVMGDLPLVVPPERTVLTLDADLVIDDEIVAGCKRLASDGFVLAVCHGSAAAANEEILGYAGIVRVDTMLAGNDQLRAVADSYAARPVRLLAERLTRRDDVETLAAHGFSLFQGFALDKPMLVSGRAVLPGPSQNLVKLAEFIGGDIDFEQIETILRRDPGLAYHVMQLASLGEPGQARVAVDSIRTALVRAGVRRVKNWLTVLLARPSGRETECYDELVTVLMRARACEQIAERRHAPRAATAFAAGMLSGLDILLATPLPEIAAALELTGELHEAAFDGTGELGAIVRGVTEYQMSGRCEGGLAAEEIEDAFTRAFPWAFDCADAAVR